MHTFPVFFGQGGCFAVGSVHVSRVSCTLSPCFLGREGVLLWEVCMFPAFRAHFPRVFWGQGGCFAVESMHVSRVSCTLSPCFWGREGVLLWKVCMFPAFRAHFPIHSPPSIPYATPCAIMAGTDMHGRAPGQLFVGIPFEKFDVFLQEGEFGGGEGPGKEAVADVGDSLGGRMAHVLGVESVVAQLVHDDFV